jgi:hypothetical protein
MNFKSDLSLKSKAAFLTDNRIQKLIIILSVIGVLNQLYQNYGIISLVFGLGLEEEYGILRRIQFMFPIVLFIISVLLFYLKKKAGWVILTALNIFLAFDYIGLGLWHNYQSSISPPASVFMKVRFSMYVPFLILHSMILYLILKKPIRKTYKVNKELIILTTVITICLILQGDFILYLTKGSL